MSKMITMENYNDKELDRWLRQNANNQDLPPAADGWDSPPEALWTNLRAGLDQRKKRRRWFVMFGFGLLLILSGSGLGYWFRTSDHAAQTPVAIEMHAGQQQTNSKTTDSPQPNKTTDNTTHKHPTVNTNTPTPAGQQASKHPAGNPVHANPQAPQNSNTFQATQTVSEDRMDTPGFEPRHIKQTAQNAPLSDTPVKVQTLPETEKIPGLDAEINQTSNFKQLLTLSQLAILPPAAINFNRSTPRLKTVEIKPVRAPQTSWYAGAFSGVFFTNRKLKNADGLKPNGQESGAQTWQQGLQIGLKLNRHWAIETGVQRTSIRLQAEREVQFQYLTDRERFNPNRFIYQNTSDQNIQTSFGEVEMRMDISREPNRPISDQAFVKLNLHTDEQVHYLRLPVIVRWSSDTGPWKWSLSGGAGFSFENGYELRMTAARTNRPGVRDISARAKSRANGLAPMYVDVQVGAGIQYRFAPKWSVQLAPEFRYGIRSMYRNGPFQSLAISTGLQFGLVYGF